MKYYVAIKMSFWQIFKGLKKYLLYDIKWLKECETIFEAETYSRQRGKSTTHSEIVSLYFK